MISSLSPFITGHEYDDDMDYIDGIKLLCPENDIIYHPVYIPYIEPEIMQHDNLLMHICNRQKYIMEIIDWLKEKNNCESYIDVVENIYIRIRTKSLSNKYIKFTLIVNKWFISNESANENGSFVYTRYHHNLIKDNDVFHDLFNQ